MILELRQSLRYFALHRVSTALVVVSLALGTSASVVLFSAVRSLLFAAPAGVQHGERLVDLYTAQYGGFRFGRSSLLDLEHIRLSVPSLSGIAACRVRQGVAGLNGEARPVQIAEVTSAYFGLLGLQPERGRLPDSTSVASAPPPAMISFTLWETLGAAPEPIGHPMPIRLGGVGRDVTIVGVLPQGFRGIHPDAAIDLWIPVDALGPADRADRSWTAFGVLANGRTVADAEGELDVVARDLARQFPQTNLGIRNEPERPRPLAVVPYSRLSPSTRTAARAVSALLVGATFLLLVSALVNASAVVMSATLARQRELALKCALGASRRRVAAHIMSEGLLITVAAAAVGLLSAYWLARLVPSLMLSEDAGLLTVSPTSAVLGAAAAIAMLMGIAIGSVPALAWLKSATDGPLGVGRTGLGPERGSARSAILVAQIGFSTVLLIVAAWSARAMSQSLQAGYAFSAPRALVASIEVSEDRAGTAALELSRRLRSQRGIEAVGSSTVLPLARAPQRTVIVTDPLQRFESIDADISSIDTGYLRAIGLPVLAGRSFRFDDTGRASPVAVVNETFARRHLGGTPVGQRIRDEHGTDVTVVGVVRDELFRVLQGSPRPRVYYPVLQQPTSRLEVVVQTSTHPGDYRAIVARELEAVDARVLRLSTFDSRMNEALALDRIVSALMLVSCALALGLALAGIYGVTRDAIASRRQEIGLRLALGAPPWRIVRVVSVPRLVLAGIGVSAGIGAALAVVRTARSMIFGLPILDSPTLAGSSLCVLLLVALSTVVPALLLMRRTTVSTLLLKP